MNKSMVIPCVIFIRFENLRSFYETGTVWKVSKYGFFSSPYFPEYGLNTGKYGLEKTPYLDTFHTVGILDLTALRIELKVVFFHSFHRKINYHLVLHTLLILIFAHFVRTVFAQYYFNKIYYLKRRNFCGKKFSQKKF